MQRVSTAVVVWVVVLGLVTLVDAAMILDGVEGLEEIRLVYLAPILWWGTLLALPGLMVMRWGSYPALGRVSAALVVVMIVWILAGIWSIDIDGDMVGGYSSELLTSRIFGVVIVMSVGLSLICLGDMVLLPGSPLCVGIGRAIQVASVMLIAGGHLVILRDVPVDDAERYGYWMIALIFVVYGLVVMGAAAIVAHYGAGRRVRLGDVFAPAPAPVGFTPPPAAPLPMRPTEAPIPVARDVDDLRPPATEAEAPQPGYEDNVPPALFLDQPAAPPSAPAIATADQAPPPAPPVRMSPPPDPTAPPANPFGATDTTAVRMDPPAPEPGPPAPGSSGPAPDSPATPAASPPSAAPPPPDLSA